MSKTASVFEQKMSKDICAAYKEHALGKNGQGCGKEPNHEGNHGDE